MKKARGPLKHRKHAEKSMKYIIPDRKWRMTQRLKPKALGRGAKVLDNDFGRTRMFLCQELAICSRLQFRLVRRESDRNLSLVFLLLNINAYCGSLVLLSSLCVGWWLRKWLHNISVVHISSHRKDSYPQSLIHTWT